MRLTYRVGDRASSAEHVVNVLSCEDCKPPLSEITTTGRVFNPSAPITIEAVIGSSSQSSYKWESVTVTDGGR